MSKQREKSLSHHCEEFNEFVYHLGFHPNLPRLPKCIEKHAYDYPINSGTISGKFSSKDPNVSNLPREFKQDEISKKTITKYLNLKTWKEKTK